MQYALLLLVSLLWYSEARAETSEQFLAGMFPIGFGSCSAPNMQVLFYCEIFTNGEHKYLVIYDEKTEPFVIQQLLEDGSSKVVWTEGKPV